MDPAAYRPDRDRYRRRDLFVGEADDVTHHHGLPELVRQLEKRRLDVVAEAHGGQLLVGSRGGVGVPAVDSLRQWGGGSSLATAHLVDEGVVGDAPQPAFERARLVVGETS